MFCLFYDYHWLVLKLFSLRTILLSQTKSDRICLFSLKSMDLSSHPPLPQRQGKAYLWGNPKIIYESAFHNIQYQQKDFSPYISNYFKQKKINCQIAHVISKCFICVPDEFIFCKNMSRSHLPEVQSLFLRFYKTFAIILLPVRGLLKT